MGRNSSTQKLEPNLLFYIFLVFMNREYFSHVANYKCFYVIKFTTTQIWLFVITTLLERKYVVDI